MKYRAFLLVAALTLGNGQLWPMGEQFNREVILKIPRPQYSHPADDFLKKTPWDTEIPRFLYETEHINEYIKEEYVDED